MFILQKEKGKKAICVLLPSLNCIGILLPFFIKKLFQKNIVTSELIFQPKNGGFDVLTMIQRRDAKMLIFF